MSQGGEDGGEDHINIPKKMSDVPNVDLPKEDCYQDSRLYLF